MSSTFIVGFDDSDQAKRALAFAAKSAGDVGGSVHIVHVLEWSPYSFHTPEELAERHGRREQELDRGRAMVQPAVDGLTKDGLKATSEVRHGNGAELLCKIADQHPNSQIVLGRTGDSSFTTRLLGGLAITLVQVAPVPVTIVP